MTRRKPGDYCRSCTEKVSSLEQKPETKTKVVYAYSKKATSSQSKLLSPYYIAQNPGEDEDEDYDEDEDEDFDDEDEDFDEEESEDDDNFEEEDDDEDRREEKSSRRGSAQPAKKTPKPSKLPSKRK